MDAPSSVTSFLASASPPQSNRSHSIAWSPAASSWAALWWKEATTRASGPRISCASSAAEPCGGGVKRRPPPKVSGTTVLTTVFPRQTSRSSGSVAASPVAGTVRTTTSALAAASRFDLPSTRLPGAAAASSAAFARARSGSREPMTTSCPACAQRSPSPTPSLPVPPTMPMRMPSPLRGLSEQVTRRVSEQGAARAVAGLPVQPADDGHRDAVELAHHRLGRAGQLVGHGQDGCLQDEARGIQLAEIAADGLKASETDRHVDEALPPRPAEGVGDDHGQLVAGQGV